MSGLLRSNHFFKPETPNCYVILKLEERFESHLKHYKEGCIGASHLSKGSEEKRTNGVKESHPQLTQILL